MKFIVFYLQSINSLEGPGMFFSSAAIIRRLRNILRHSPSLRKDIPWSKFFLCFQWALLLTKLPHKKTQLSRGSQSHELHQLVNEDSCLLIESIEITKETL